MESHLIHSPSISPPRGQSESLNSFSLLPLSSLHVALSLSRSFSFSFLFPLHTSLLPSLFGHHGLTETRHVSATEEDQLSTVRPPEFQPKTTLCVAYAWSLSVRFRPPFFLDSNVVRPQFLAKLAWLEPTFDDLQNRAPPH